MLRVGVGSAVQLSFYDQVKHFNSSFEFFQKYPDMLPMVSAFVTSTTYFYLRSLKGFPVAVAMNPVDCVATRLYNQPVLNGRGTLYTGPFNCLRRTFHEEGFQGLYKGTFANYVRLGPHTVCTFVFWEKTKELVSLLDDYC
jgi:solute carrier family 25 protein 34/35